MDEINNKDSEINSSLEFNSDSQGHLDEARKWSMFLSILGFIAVGLMVVASILAGIFIMSFGAGDISPLIGIGISVLYLIIAALYFFPVLYLFNFSSKAKEAIRTKDSEMLGQSMRFLKAHYRFFGIMIIVMLVLYPLIILLFVLGGLISGF